MTAITKYCPWCDYNNDSLSAVLEHKAVEHAFLAGIAPPVDPRFTISVTERIDL